MIKDINIDTSDWTTFHCIELGDDVPKVGCVYFLFCDDELVYIGNTKNIRTRSMYHNIFLNPNIYVGTKKVSKDVFNKIYYRLEDSLIRRRELEKAYYNAFKPKLNFEGVFSPYMYLNQARVMEYRLFMGLEKRYEV